MRGNDTVSEQKENVGSEVPYKNKGGAGCHRDNRKDLENPRNTAKKGEKQGRTIFDSD